MGAATLIGARLLQFSGALILFGAPLFYLYGFESAAAGSVTSARWSWQRPVLLIAAATALVGTLLWVMAETASFGDAAMDAFNPSLLRTVLWETRFGLACLARIVLLALSIIASLCIGRLKVLWIVQTILGGSATASFVWTGHGAMDAGAVGAIHLMADLVHLLAAGIWFGALLPLAALVLRSIRSQAPPDLRATLFGLDRFSAIGVWVVAALVLSGIVNSWFLIGPSNWRALFLTPYGMTLLVKLGLFGVMLALAARNRFWLSPALQADVEGGQPARTSLSGLRISVVMELGLALLVLAAVSVLGTLAPPISGE